MDKPVTSTKNKEISLVALQYYGLSPGEAPHITPSFLILVTSMIVVVDWFWKIHEFFSFQIPRDKHGEQGQSLPIGLLLVYYLDPATFDRLIACQSLGITYHGAKPCLQRGPCQNEVWKEGGRPSLSLGYKVCKDHNLPPPTVKSIRRPHLVLQDQRGKKCALRRGPMFPHQMRHQRGFMSHKLHLVSRLCSSRWYWPTLLYIA